MYAVSFIYSNLSPHCFLFHPFKTSFSLSKENGLFHHYHRRRFSFQLKLSTSLSPTSVTTRLDCCYHRQFNPKPSYFYHLAGGRVKEFHKEASSNDNTKTDRHSSSIARPQGAACEGECYTNALIYIQPTPKPPHIRGC